MHKFRITRKRELYARVSHSSLQNDRLYYEVSPPIPVACNAACVQGKYSCKCERGTHHEVHVFVKAIKRRYGCVYVCLSSSTTSTVDSYLCVYAMKEFREVFKRDAPRNVCVFVHARSSVGMGMWVCHLHYPVCSYLCACMYVYVCMYVCMNVNTAERL